MHIVFSRRFVRHCACGDQLRSHISFHRWLLLWKRGSGKVGETYDQPIFLTLSVTLPYIDIAYNVMPGRLTVASLVGNPLIS